MSLRENLNNNPAIATSAAVVVLLLCLLLIYCQFSGGSSSSFDMIYYNVTENKIELVTHKAGGGTLESPLSGTETYQASVYSCGECKEITDGMTQDELKAQDMFIGYLHKPGADEFSYEIRTLENNTWINVDSEQGQRVMNEINSKCPGASAQVCGVKPRD